MISRTGALAVFALVLTGCGGPSVYAPEERSMEMAMMAPDTAYEPVSADMSEKTGDPSGGQYIAYAHNVGLRLPVKAVEPTMLGHIDACNRAGTSVCIVTGSWMNAYSEDEVSASLDLRATPEWIASFLSGIEAEAEAARGEVTSRQTTAEDLTVSIIDTGARLNAQKTLQGRLEKLLSERPGELGEILETERELARVNAEIDSLSSSLAALRQRVDMSRLSVSYSTKTNPVSQGALEPLSEALGDFFYNLAGAVAAVITAFAIGLPWLLLIGALLWIWLRLIWPRIRRRRDS